MTDIQIKDIIYEDMLEFHPEFKEKLKELDEQYKKELINEEVKSIDI